MSEIDITKTKVAEPDLDKLRDDKCTPLARGILSDMVAELVPEDINSKVDFHPLVIKCLKRSLEADLNLTTETTYIFQLILSVFSGLNQVAQTIKTQAIDDIRYGKISQRIIEILATSDLPMTNVKKEDIEKIYAPVKEKLEAICIEEKLTSIELKYILDNIFTCLNQVQTIYTTSIEESTRRAEAKLFGVTDMTEVSMKKLDEVLMAGTEKAEEKSV